MANALGWLQRTLAAALAVAFIVLFYLSDRAIAEETDWYVERDTWLTTYRESLGRLCQLEREQGRTIPALRNEKQLPTVVYGRSFDQLKPVEFEVDVTGVETLYLGASSRVDLQDTVLIDESGGAHPLVGPDDLNVAYTKTNDRGRCEFFRGRSQTDACRVIEAELALELGGKYRCLRGTLSSGEITVVVWIDAQSHFEQWGQSSRARRDLWHRLDRMFREKYADGLHANALREEMSRIRWAMPSFHRPIDPREAAAIFAGALCERYGEQVDERIVGAITKAAGGARSFEDFERLVRLGPAMVNYSHFRHIRDLATRTEENPGLRPAFAKIEEEFFLLDADRVDYGLPMREKLDAFKDTIEECKEAAAQVRIAKDTIEYVHKVKPVSDDVRRRLEVLQQQLDENKHDLDAFLAVRDRIRRLRREVLFSHPALDFDRILINRTPPTLYSHNGDQHLGRHSRVGPGLTVLSEWKSAHPKATAILEGKLPLGAVRNPDLHYDAGKVVFAFCDHSAENARNEQKRYFLYEAAVDGSWVRQLTGTERDPLETWDGRATALIEDNDPCYLPDGGLVFISTRSQSFGRCHGGRYNPAWVLHRCDGEGNGIRQLSFGNENEYEPSVLNDGRIVFTRWEYTNRHEMFHHMLWWCRADGTAVSHFYGNDTLHPMMVVEATAIPGTHRIAATAQGHHSYNTGTTVILDTNRGDNGEEPVTHVTTETPYSETHGWPSPHFSHPYPINEDLFLVSRANHPVQPQGRTPPPADRAIYLVDTLGGRELIYEDPEVASFSPIAIRPRIRPPASASIPQRATPDYGTVFIQNAYLTGNDPEGLIKPGSIGAIRVNALGVQPRAHRSACSMTVGVEIPKKVLGTVPINDDGSAYFKVPARTALQLQILDENGMAILTEKSFFYLQPGETRSCVGCHAPAQSSPPSGSVSRSLGRRPVDLDPAAGPQYPGGLSFMRTVQPVLDRYCISCHGLDRTDEQVDLVMNVETFPQSYRALVERGDHRLGQKGYKTDESTISRPYEYYAHSNKIAHMLVEGHGDLKDDRESLQRVIEWLDLNAQCYGDLFPNKIEERRIDSAALESLRAYVGELFGEKMAAQPERALVNVAQPEESRILMAPLATNAGGWGQIEGWNSRDDAGYQKMAQLVEQCLVKRTNENQNGWQPTLESGGGEDWVIKARESYRRQFAVED